MASSSRQTAYRPCASPARPEVDIVIPSRDGRALLEKNLPPILECCRTEMSEGRASLIVCDDASTDGSVAFLAERFPAVRVIENPGPRGFGHAVNRGVAAGSAPFVLVMNNDLRPELGFLGPLLDACSGADVFAVVGRILRRDATTEALLNESGMFLFWRDGRIRLRRIEHEIMERIREPVEIPMACGACVVYRRDFFSLLHGFDPILNPFFWEDALLSLRAHRRGYRVLYQPLSTVHHEHNVTISRDYPPAMIERIFWRNFFLFNEINLIDQPSLAAFHRYMLRTMAGLALRGHWPRFAGAVDAIRRRTACRERRRHERREAVVDNLEIWRRFASWERRFRHEAEVPANSP